jgi:hypothetical protein
MIDSFVIERTKIPSISNYEKPGQFVIFESAENEVD